MKSVGAYYLKAKMLAPVITPLSGLCLLLNLVILKALFPSLAHLESAPLVFPFTMLVFVACNVIAVDREMKHSLERVPIWIAVVILVLGLIPVLPWAILVTGIYVVYYYSAKKWAGH